MMTPQQMENYIQQLLRSQEQQSSAAATQAALLSQLQLTVNSIATQIAALASTGTGTPSASSGNIYDTYRVNGGILHKLVTTFQLAVTFATTILVTGIATFTAAPVLSALTASLPLQLTAGKAITAALINLTSAVTGILPRANGGLGNGTVTPYAGTITGVTAGGTFSGTISGTANLITGAVTGTCSGTTSADSVTGSSSTSI